MTPFLASSVHVRKPDGTVMDLNSDNSDGSGGDTSANVGVNPTVHSKHYSSSSELSEAVPIVAIVFVFLWLIVKALMAPFTQKNGRRNQSAVPPVGAGLTDEEQAILEKLQRTLGQMERRIESLETILIDESRSKESYGPKRSL